MSGISPNYADWRQLSALPIWKIASLIQGFDPRAVEAGEVAVQDPFEPTSACGVSPDFSWEIEVLVTAVQTADLVSVPANITRPNKNTKITKVSLILWLRANGYGDLANGLDASSQQNCQTLQSTLFPSTESASQVPINGTLTKWTPERKDEARKMLDREKARGVKNYAARTAAAFAVSPARLRQVLRNMPKKESDKRAASHWSGLAR